MPAGKSPQITTVTLQGLDEFLERLKNAVEGTQGLNIIALEAADEIYRLWRETATNKLNSSREDYLRNLQPPKVTNQGVEVSLDTQYNFRSGNFPIWVELGKDPYDVGQLILERGAYTNRDGARYKRVPFKQTPAPRNRERPVFNKGSTPMGYGYRSGTRGKITPYSPDVVNKRQLEGAYKDWRAAGRRAEAGTQLRDLSSRHSGPIYNRQQPDVSGVGNVTFRTVTEESTGWIHPGIQGRHLAEEAMRKFNRGQRGAVVVSKQIKLMFGDE